jgi:hypothetical protein
VADDAVDRSDEENSLREKQASMLAGRSADVGNWSAIEVIYGSLRGQGLRDIRAACVVTVSKLVADALFPIAQTRPFASVEPHNCFTLTSRHSR